jgi:hypothetical protein
LRSSARAAVYSGIVPPESLAESTFRNRLVILLALAGFAAAAGAAYLGDESVNPLVSSPAFVEPAHVVESAIQTEPVYHSYEPDGALTLSEVVESEVDRPGPNWRNLRFEGVEYDLEVYVVAATGENAALLRTRDGRLVGACLPDPRHGGFVDYRSLRAAGSSNAASDRDLLAHDLGPNGLGRFVAGAMALEAGAELGIINFSALTGHIPAGSVSTEIIVRALPYADRIALVKLSGSQLAALRRNDLAEPKRLAISTPAGADPAAELAPDRIYTVAVSNYLFDPRAGVPIIQNTTEIGGENITVRDAVFRHLGGTSRTIEMSRGE